MYTGQTPCENAAATFGILGHAWITDLRQSSTETTPTVFKFQFDNVFVFNYFLKNNINSFVKVVIVSYVFRCFLYFSRINFDTNLINYSEILLSHVD